MQMPKSCCIILEWMRFILSVLILVPLAGIEMGRAQTTPERYVCSPCGLPCDAKFFDKPGNCPACGMPLVTEEEAKAATAKAEPTKKVAILIFDGVEIIDFTGPYEVFGAANFDVYTVARTMKPITTAMGMTVTPKFSFEDVPLPDVLVVPGGGVKATQEDSITLKWIVDESAKIGHTMSVCNGAFLLASAGLLDGLSATTTYHNIPRLRDQFPKIHVVDNQRYVDNGKIITAAGLSAGIDGALHVLEVLMGKGYAQMIALGEEYEWKPRGAFVRASLADKMIPDVHIAEVTGRWDLASTEGGTDHWQRVFKGTSDKSAKEILVLLGDAYARSGNWQKEGTGDDGRTRWKVKGSNGEYWTGEVTIRTDPVNRHLYTVIVKVVKGV